MRLADLGLSTADGALILFAPPDSVLAEAGGMKPRPSIASSLNTGEPCRRIAWWPQQATLTAANLSRLRWMVETAQGRAWLIFDPTDEDGPAAEDVRAAVATAGFTVASERADAGEVAIEVVGAAGG